MFVIQSPQGKLGKGKEKVSNTEVRCNETQSSTRAEAWRLAQLDTERRFWASFQKTVLISKYI